ncbi:MAG: outer membrane lipoprotein-sorting protein, partial [Prolixibacteraceae bacterium]|nr:outer membrane lipoprotein-sorting protein [Prolixibacteraceae bacterium]
TTIEKSNFLAHKIEYYDSDNELLRVQSISDYRKQANDGYFAFHMDMKNVQNQRRSVMKVEKFQMGSTLPETHFSPNSLVQ